jgi:hypothetical protein
MEVTFYGKSKRKCYLRLVRNTKIKGLRSKIFFTSLSALASSVILISDIEEARFEITDGRTPDKPKGASRINDLSFTIHY